MPRHHATDTERIEAQRAYRRGWYQRNKAREQKKMRDRYAAKKAVEPADAEPVDVDELDELIDAICDAR